MVWLTGGLEAAIVLHAVNNVLVFVLAGALGEGVATEEVPEGSGVAAPADQPRDDGRVRRGGGPVPAPAAARDAHRGAGPADARHRPCRWPRADPPTRGGCHPARSRRVSSSAAPRGATHGVWGNWQPDGFWFR